MIDNTIHIIRFTPRKYILGPSQIKKYLCTEDGKLILTEDGKKIRL